MEEKERREREKRWARQIRGGDRAAFDALFRAYYEALCAFIRRQISSPEVAEGLVQDIFLDLWRPRREWIPNRSVRAYLYGAARNKTIKYIEHQQVVRRWEARERHREPPSTRSPEETLRYREMQEAIQKAIGELPERRRMVFVLSREHGLTYKEIAASMDISVSTVEVQMWRALKHLRARLASYLTAVL